MSGWRVAALVLLATLLAQAAWILAVPPFRGMDEFDHAFRAAGVASGQWRLHDQAEGGRGLLVDVPDDLLAASKGQCESLAYIVPETCAGDGPGAEPGTVRATTSAANYEPIYYWVVGTAGEPFTGANSLYAMRAMAALLCALVLALAAWCLTTWVRGTWAFVGLLVGLTPTLIYSTTLAAPNGLEMAAGVLLWTALLGLGGRDEIDAALLRRERWLLVAATLSVVLLAGLRTLGPLWGVLILACVMALRGPGNVLAAAARHRGQVVLGSVLAVGTCVAVLLWNRGNIPIAPGAKNGDIDTSWMQVARWPNWILGNIGAFPYRDQPAPLEAYVLVAARDADTARRIDTPRRGRGPAGGRPRGRARLGGAVGAGRDHPAGARRDVAGPVQPSLHCRHRHAGGAGPGPRALAFEPPGPSPPALALVMLAVAQVISVVHVQLAELHRSVSADDAGWLHPPAAATGVLTALAWVVLGAVALSMRPLDAAAPDAASGRAEAMPEPRAR